MIHFQKHFYGDGEAACNAHRVPAWKRDGGPFRTTEQASEVTCPACKRTRAYRNRLFRENTPHPALEGKGASR